MFNIILRGGRLTKYKGKTASCAPGLGVSSSDGSTDFTFTPIALTSASGMFNFSASGEVQSAFDGGYKAIGQVRGAVRF